MRCDTLTVAVSSSGGAAHFIVASCFARPNNLAADHCCRRRHQLPAARPDGGGALRWCGATKNCYGGCLSAFRQARCRTVPSLTARVIAARSLSFASASVKSSRRGRSCIGWHLPSTRVLADGYRSLLQLLRCQGWDEGVARMSIGEVRCFVQNSCLLTIPPLPLGAARAAHMHT